MIPLRDNIPPRTFPVVNYSLIALCALVFFLQVASGEEGGRLIERYGMIPARVIDPGRPVVVREAVEGRGFFARRVRERLADEPPIAPWLTLLTCIFLHGGWLHFLGNMWFLHIFGDNVEDRMGHFGYLAFYLGTGVAASVSHLATSADSTMPTVGASGAIAGVMGSYLLLYPRAHVITLVPTFFFIEVMVLPAPLFLGVWFLLQAFQGTLALTNAPLGGVAWWAHIGGFAAGFAVTLALKSMNITRSQVDRVRPRTERVTYYRYR